ncbi:MAG TPA: hypothetical protein VNG29_04240 [Candidatus Paceibacterota bacterium]|nr:hypothetical protein [Candidatus Paceibacterota bacterium]
MALLDAFGNAIFFFRWTWFVIFLLCTALSLAAYRREHGELRRTGNPSPSGSPLYWAPTVAYLSFVFFIFSIAKTF